VGAWLGEVASVIGAEGAVELAALGRQWAGLVGDEVAAHSWPVSLRNGVLTLGTDHHAWASELRLLSGELLARLRPAGFAIESVSVQVGPSEGRGW
jgi:predicted nucleic acid-binding Zn ribbon protein